MYSWWPLFLPSGTSDLMAVFLAGLTFGFILFPVVIISYFFLIIIFIFPIFVLVFIVFLFVRIIFIIFFVLFLFSLFEPLSRSAWCL